MDFDTSSLAPYQQRADQATQDLSTQISSAPGLLNELRSNLTKVFVKDNPFIAERGQALEGYLNAPSATRASLLPGGMPNVEGSPLTLSPTQQDAITTARQNAALVPLLGLNQIVTGLYGNIPQMVQNAGNIYQSGIESARERAAGARQDLATQLDVLTKKESVRQYEKRLCRKT